MVRVPGSSGDSGFHRESQEDVKVKVEPGIEASTEEEGSPSTLWKEEGSADQQRPGRDSADVKEEAPSLEYEEKAPYPPQVPSGTPADRDENRDPPDEDSFSIRKESSSTTSARSTHHPSKPKKSKSSRQKLKAPDSDAEDRGEGEEPTTDQLLQAFHWSEITQLLSKNVVLKIMKPKLIGTLTGPVTYPKGTSIKLEAVHILINILKEAGFTLGAFDPNALFDRDLDTLVKTAVELHTVLAAVVGTKVSTTTNANLPLRNAAERRGTGSSQYASATSEAGSSGSGSSIALQRMSLGPSGAAMLGNLSQETTQDRPFGNFSSPPTKPTNATPIQSDAFSPIQMQTYFNMAMERFMKEQRSTSTVESPPPAKLPDIAGAPDVDMESVGSRHDHANEYDPDDLDLDDSRRPIVATTGLGTSDATSIPRIRVSAISELKEFSGRENDEDRARSWLGKVKSAYIRDQAPNSEKCLVFGDLLTGPARNWYRQLSRSTRNNWQDLYDGFQVQYCGRGVSVARQYYHAKQRSGESPLEYLHRLNVAGMRAKLPIKDGSSSARREHVEHFIETLDDRDLADQLALLRLIDADALEETLRARHRAKARQSKAAFGSSKYRAKALPAPPAVSKPARAVRAIQAKYADTSESESDSGGSGSDIETDPFRVYAAELAQRENRETPRTDRRENRDQSKTNRDRDQGQNRSGGSAPCSHCGSTKHGDLGCWKRLICQKCGRKGHPSDNCLFVCRACGELHEAGKCPMEEFYNLIRQWYAPDKHAGMLPAGAEKMLN